MYVCIYIYILYKYKIYICMYIYMVCFLFFSLFVYNLFIDIKTFGLLYSARSSLKFQIYVIFLATKLNNISPITKRRKYLQISVGFLANFTKGNTSLSNGINGPEPNRKAHRMLTIFQEVHKVESFFDKFVNYVIVDLLEMECTLAILLQVFLKATNIDFFV